MIIPDFPAFLSLLVQDRPPTYFTENLPKFRKGTSMARTVRDTNLETRTARARLKARGEPYWRAIDRGAHLGYYRGARGGSWIARLYREGRYQKHDLGRADDVTDGDGLHVLDYSHAL